MTRPSEVGTSTMPRRPFSSAPSSAHVTYRLPLRRLGKGCLGSMTIGDMIGAMDRSYVCLICALSASVRSSLETRVRPCSARLLSMEANARPWRAMRSGSIPSTVSICSDGVWFDLFSRGWCFSSVRSLRPPILIMNHSSRLLPKIETNFSRSNRGTVSSKASSSTRLSKRSQLTSLFCVYEKSRAFACASFWSLALTYFAARFSRAASVCSKSVAASAPVVLSFFFFPIAFRPSRVAFVSARR